MTKGEIFVAECEKWFKNPFGAAFKDKINPLAEPLSEDVARETASNLCEGRKNFPDFKACRRVLKAAADRVSRPVSTAPKPWDKSDWRAEAAERLAGFQLCRTDPRAKEAARDGWLLSLLEWVTKEKRLPNELEVKGIKAWSQKVDDNLHREPKPVMYRFLCELRQSMKDRAVREVFGAGLG
jgi:hypothetical protein